MSKKPLHRGLAMFALAAASQVWGQSAPMASATSDQLVDKLKGTVDARGSIEKTFGARNPRVAGQCRRDVDYVGTIEKNFVPALEYPDGSNVQLDLNIQFAINSHEILPASRPLLDELAKALRDPRLGSAQFVVAGHTDTTGSADFNDSLSCARAISVRQYLVGRGVDASRLGLYGFGYRRLLAGFGPEDPRHRRVEVRRAPDQVR